MDNYIDRTGPVRPGEGLDTAKLESHLREHLPDVSGPLVVEQFPQGYSNLTYLLRMGEKELVLRRPPFGSQVKTAHDMGREYRVLSKLHEVYEPAPRPLLYCEDASILGAPFYVMERRRGIILRKTLPPSLKLDAETAHQLCHSFVDNLALLHSLDYEAAGLGDLGKPEGYVERQVTGWTKRYRDAQTDEVPHINQIAAWLAGRIPQESGATLIHNDYKYDNLVLDPDDLTRIIAVLDWEMCTIGDPLMDFGTTLGYWIEASDDQAFQAMAFGPTMLPGSLTRREMVERYAEKTGRDVSNILFYYCFALFKIAVIVQQIYYRYVKGHTRDDRFSRLNEVVALLGKAAVQAAEQGKF